MWIPLQLRGTLSCFKTWRLMQKEVTEAGKYPIIFISPDFNDWNPNNSDWAAQEEEMLDADREIIHHGMKEPVELVTEGDYFNMGSLEALRVCVLTWAPGRKTVSLIMSLKSPRGLIQEHKDVPHPLVF